MEPEKYLEERIMENQNTTVTVTTSTAQGTPQGTPPVSPLKTHRGVLKFVLLTFVTFGIYAIAFYAGIGNDINVIASRYDGKKTMNHWLLTLVIAPLTLSIGYFVWNHNLAKRVGKELRRRGHMTTFGAGTYWLWCFLGLFIGIGPFIYTHKLCKAMNKLAEDYNQNG